MADILVKILSR